jgi:multidrug efflux system membrane fusion protein
VTLPIPHRPLSDLSLFRAAVLGILLLSPLVAACTDAQEAQPGAEPGTGGGGARGGRGGRGGEGGPVPVVTAAAVAKSVPITEMSVGTVEAISTVLVRSQVTGRLMKVHFTEGDEVVAGQLLFTIDPQPFQVALDQAKAVLARDKAQADNADAQLARYKNLVDRGIVPREQYETQLAGATALKATTEAGAAAVAAAQLNLQYTQILAPASGRTGALQAHEGDLVQANGPFPLVVTNQLAPIYVAFSVPGKLLDNVRRLHRRSPLRVSARAGGAEETSTVTGRLTFIDNAVDPSTGTIKLKATFPNTDHALWPGQFVEATLMLSDDLHAVVVPSVAVQAGQQGPYVFVVDDTSHVQLRSVSVARVTGDESVIGSGLEPGEIVVTDGHLRLTPGAPVAPREPVTAASSGAS